MDRKHRFLAEGRAALPAMQVRAEDVKAKGGLPG